MQPIRFLTLLLLVANILLVPVQAGSTLSQRLQNAEQQLVETLKNRDDQGLADYVQTMKIISRDFVGSATDQQRTMLFISWLHGLALIENAIDKSETRKLPLANVPLPGNLTTPSVAGMSGQHIADAKTKTYYLEAIRSNAELAKETRFQHQLVASKLGELNWRFRDFLRSYFSIADKQICNKLVEKVAKTFTDKAFTDFWQNIIKGVNQRGLRFDVNEIFMQCTSS